MDTIDQEQFMAKVCALDFSYGDGVPVLKNVDLPVCLHRVTALIGPSGSGKTTLLRAFLPHQMRGLSEGDGFRAFVQGEIRVYPENIDLLAPETELSGWSRRVARVSQTPAMYSGSVAEVLAAALAAGRPAMQGTDAEHGERVLRSVGLWNEVKDRLSAPASALSGGQQQRLSIALALIGEPELLLLDDPMSALDPKAAAVIEELLLGLKTQVSILLVSHDLQQVARVSDYTACMYSGEMIEFARTDELFIKPQDPRTQDYITVRLG